jgi:hypothetical protein
MNRAIGLFLLVALGLFFGLQTIGAAVMFWPAVLVLAVWWISAGRR